MTLRGVGSDDTVATFMKIGPWERPQMARWSPLLFSILVLAGCYEPRYDTDHMLQERYRWENPVAEEWEESSGILRGPDYDRGDELLQIDKIDVLSRGTEEGAAMTRTRVGYVEYLRLEGEDQGHVVRFVLDASFRRQGAILPTGRTLRFTDDGGYRDVGDFGYSDTRQYHYAIKNILNVDGDIDASPWDGSGE